jgi:hypothetical protein
MQRWGPIHERSASQGPPARLRKSSVCADRTRGLRFAPTPLRVASGLDRDSARAGWQLTATARHRSTAFRFPRFQVIADRCTRTVEQAARQPVRLALFDAEERRFQEVRGAVRLGCLPATNCRSSFALSESRAQSPTLCVRINYRLTSGVVPKGLNLRPARREGCCARR